MVRPYSSVPRSAERLSRERGERCADMYVDSKNGEREGTYGASRRKNMPAARRENPTKMAKGQGTKRVSDEENDNKRDDIKQ